VVPSGTEAVTGATVAQEAADAIQDDLKFVTIMFSIFAGVALFVGAFIIWNTFTMVVAQRSREIALLRAVGATRRQVMRSLVTEAWPLDLVASAIGIVLGVLVAKGLNALMARRTPRRRLAACEKSPSVEVLSGGGRSLLGLDAAHQDQMGLDLDAFTVAGSRSGRARFCAWGRRRRR
jgi:ABC-type antimicrobial peptide transport system permease subunit